MKGFTMKCKLIVAGLLLCAVLSACAPEKDPFNTDEGDITTALTTTRDPSNTYSPVDPPDFPAVVQSGIGETTETLRYTEGEHTILNVTMILPVANVEGNDTLQATLSARLDTLHKQLRQEIDRLYQQYLADYKAGREGLTTPSVQVRFELHYFTSEAASMTYILTETTGDGIVYTYSYHSNLDLRVGSEIRLTALLTDGKVDGLLTLLQSKLTASPPEGLYDNTLQNLETVLDGSWYIADGKLAIQLAAGTIAPLSSGNILLTFTKAELDGLLSAYGQALL